MTTRQTGAEEKLQRGLGWGEGVLGEVREAGRVGVCGWSNQMIIEINKYSCSNLKHKKTQKNAWL